MATEILLASKGTTVPLRLMTRNWPGAVAAIAPLTAADSGCGVVVFGGSAAMVGLCLHVCSGVPAFSFIG